MTSRVAIIGGGGFGREILGYLQQDSLAGRADAMELVGVVDDDPACQTARCNSDVSHFRSIRDVTQWRDCLYLIALGSIRLRRKVATELQSLNLTPYSYIHPSVLVAFDCKIGQGCVIAPGTIVNAGAVVEDFCVLNVYCSIAHGAKIGAYSVLSPYCAVNGDAAIGENCFMGTRSTIFPGVKLGSDCIVDTHAYVKKSVGDKKIISLRGSYLELDNRLGGRSE